MSERDRLLADAVKRAEALADRVKAPLLYAEQLTSDNAPHHRWYLLFHLRECKKMAAQLEETLELLTEEPDK